MIDLCRYMSFQRFCEILFNQELVLVKPEMWNDKFESYIFQVIKNSEEKERVEIYLKDKFNASTEQIKMMFDFIRLVCESTHCLCFSSEIDSEVMWNAYSYDSQAIMMVTSFDEIEKINTPRTPDFEIRKIRYDLENTGLKMMMELLNIENEEVSIKNSEHFFSHKRKCFEYEKEYRLIVSNHKNKNKRLVHYPINNLSEFIKGIMVHPLANDSYTSLIEKMCNKFNIKYLGKSNIYDFNAKY